MKRVILENDSVDEVTTSFEIQDEVYVVKTGQVGFVTDVKPVIVKHINTGQVVIVVCMYGDGGEMTFHPKQLDKMPTVENTMVLSKDCRIGKIDFKKDDLDVTLGLLYHLTSMNV